MNFWQKMKNENGLVLCLAPMADVTDVAFRHIIAKYSKQNYTTFSKSQGEPLAYVTYTEFVSADGLVRAPEEGRRKLLKDLEYSEIERPIIAQFFTSKPEMMEKVAELASQLGFDGVDINMGCPDQSIEKQGAGAALIKNPTLAKEIILATKQGAPTLPVSVKTRIGYNKNELETWLPNLLETNPTAIVIHSRTRKEMSKVPAHFEHIKRAVEIRGAKQTLIIGNGDVEDTDDARRKCEETGADGAMLGRAVFGNPWLFSNTNPTPKQRLEVLLEHVKLFEEKLGGVKSFAIMKKHFKAYLKDIEGSKNLKEELMATNSATEVEQIVNNFLVSYT